MLCEVKCYYKYNGDLVECDFLVEASQQNAVQHVKKYIDDKTAGDFRDFTASVQEVIREDNNACLIMTNRQYHALAK